ncbi:MAG: hypothetical protein ABSC38_01285 [Verrucomicrobiia bacterium]|jgi:hypothetical protein
MNTKWIAILVVTVALVAGALMVAQAQNQPKAAAAQADAKLDKIIQQNEKILSNQGTILGAIADLRESILILKRRSS